MKIDQKENLCNTMITDFMASSKAKWKKFTQNRIKYLARAYLEQEAVMAKKLKEFDSAVAKADKAKAKYDKRLHQLKIQKARVKRRLKAKG